MKHQPIRILQILIGGKTFSGVASYLYQQYSHIDREKVQYDFLFCKENSMTLQMGNPIFKDSAFYELHATCRKRSNDYPAITRGVDQILHKQKYEAVVVNTTVVAAVAACMKAVKRHQGVAFIAHAHNTDVILKDRSIRKKLRFLFQAMDEHYRKQIRAGADYLFACSEDAGRVSFGTDAVRQENFIVIRDAIDINKFQFDQEARSSVRAELKTPDGAFVIGNVGKLSKGKNQKFLIEVFAEVVKRKPNTELWLIGDGPDREMLQEYARSLSVDFSVRFLGQKADVYRWFQGMDSFVFTTLSEGLGIVAIEAQAAGLPTTVSDGVPDDVMLSRLIQKCQLSEPVCEWAEKILLQADRFPERADVREQLRNGGYDINAETQKVEHFYCALADKDPERRLSE